MKLQEFVTETLTQVLAGVQDAQTKIETDDYDPTRSAKISPPISTTAERLESKGYRIDAYERPVQNIEFDVAVTVNETMEAKGGAGLLVATIGLGARAEVGSTDTTVHRIKFAVPVVLPKSRE